MSYTQNPMLTLKAAGHYRRALRGHQQASAEWGRREGRGGARQSQADGRPAGLCSPTRPRAASGRGSHASGLLGEEQASFSQREGKCQGLLVTAAVFFHVAVLTNSPVPWTVFAEGERTCLRSLQHVKARDDLPTGVTRPLCRAHRRHHVGCRALSLCLKCTWPGLRPRT